MNNSIYSSHIIQVALFAASIVAFHVPASAATYTVLHHFGGTTNNGSHPQGTLVMDRLGNIYGTTAHGGQNNRGTIFRYDPTAVSPTSAVAVIHNFANLPSNDGQRPSGSLVADSLGNIYGTTEGGGPNDFGTVFKWDSENGLSTLWRFTGTNGEFPHGLTRDSAGNLIGMTAFGGDFAVPGAGVTGYGVIYKISPTGAFTRLFSFSGNNGAGSNSPLVRKGNVLYGTTLTGGPVSGTIFRINANGTGFDLLHNGGAGGFGYSGGLTKNPLGTDFYGTAHFASPSGPGGIYKISSTGAYTFLKAFSGPDGAYPNSTLIADAQGKFYGMTQGYYAGCSNGSGEGGYGNVFKYDPVTNGFETLHQFTGGPADGANPCNGELLRDAAGNLYGVTQFGGTNNRGVLFRIVP